MKVLQSHREKALGVARANGYENLITQHAPNGNAPRASLFVKWILDEANNESVLRDQIGDQLLEIENDGHNTNRLTTYYTRDKQYVNRLLFKPSDLSIKCSKSEGEGIFDYELLLNAISAFHGGSTVKSFHFSFKAQTEYFRFTKAYIVKAIGYPLYTGTTQSADPDQ